MIQISQVLPGWLSLELLTVDNLGSHLVLGDDQVIGDGGQLAAHFLITDHGASEKERSCTKKNDYRKEQDPMSSNKTTAIQTARAPPSHGAKRLNLSMFRFNKGP